jgi:hypothetical protein
MSVNRTKCILFVRVGAAWHLLPAPAVPFQANGLREGSHRSPAAQEERFIGVLRHVGIGAGGDGRHGLEVQRALRLAQAAELPLAESQVHHLTGAYMDALDCTLRDSR